jgi:hypothetical protein
MPEADFKSETRILRRVVRDPKCRFVFVRHCELRMAERGIAVPAVLRVLDLGRVAWVEQKQDVVWHVEGRDIDGRRLRVVVAVFEDLIKIKVITTFDI